MADLPLPQISQIREKKNGFESKKFFVSSEPLWFRQSKVRGHGSSRPFFGTFLGTFSLKTDFFFCTTKMNDIKETTFK